MDKYTLQEEAWQRGFERGYVRGMLDQTADAMNGEIAWRAGHPAENEDLCCICQALGNRKYVIRTAKYVKQHQTYLVEDFTEEGDNVQSMIPDMDILAWAHMGSPFPLYVPFRVPEAR